MPRRKRSSDATANRYCSVCGEQIKLHECIHYGALSCYSCRAFFRRLSQESQLEDTAQLRCLRHGMSAGPCEVNVRTRKLCQRCSCRAFFRRLSQESQLEDTAQLRCLRHCMSMGPCEVNTRTRKLCQRCRYDKCLAAGMRPELVLTLRDKTRRFKKRLFQRRSGQEELGVRGVFDHLASGENMSEEETRATNLVQASGSMHVLTVEPEQGSSSAPELERAEPSYHSDDLDDPGFLELLEHRPGPRSQMSSARHLQEENQYEYNGHPRASQEESLEGLLEGFLEGDTESADLWTERGYHLNELESDPQQQQHQNQPLAQHGAWNYHELSLMQAQGTSYPLQETYRVLDEEFQEHPPEQN